MDRRGINLNDQDLFTGTAPADYDAVRVGGKRSTAAGAARHAGRVDPVSYTHLTLPTSDLV